MRETNDDGRVFINVDEHSAVWLNPVFFGIPYTSGTSYGFTPSCYKHSGQGIFLYCGYLQFSCLVDAFRHFLRRLPNFNPSMPPSEEDPAFDCLRQWSEKSEDLEGTTFLVVWLRQKSGQLV